MELADIGKTFRRLDYETKVTGRAQYLADMSLPGMCHGKILRSPYAHARVKKIDISRASKIAGVVAVLTRDDILHDQGIEPYYGPVFKDQTIVATEKVRHMGDPVAAVAALTADAAEAVPAPQSRDLVLVTPPRGTQPALTYPSNAALAIRHRRGDFAVNKVAPPGYLTVEDGGVVLVRGRNGDMDVQVPTVSVGAQPLLYVSAGQRTVRNVGTSF